MRPTCRTTGSAATAILRPKDLTQKPLMPSGSTPLGASLVSFRNWYKGCTSSTDACNGVTGWDDFAAANDSSWGCRRKFVLVLTDGDETCGGAPCAMTDVLDDTDGNGDGVSTFVVGFGVPAGANVLTCMAANGGTGDPILPQNKQELIDALTGILSQIREEASAFASAAVPQVQANATDKIFLSSFTPMGDEGFWAGRMDSFLKPLPLDDQGRPDRTELCDADTLASCFLWDAGDVQEGLASGGGTYTPRGLLLQAPHPDDVDATPPFDAAELMLGTGADERRVVYTQWNEPGNRRLFTYPSTNSQKYDLWDGMGIGYIVGDTGSETAADDRANAIVTQVLLEKEGSIEVPDPGNPGSTITTPVTYLLGDIFHADPLVTNRPTNFTYYTSDPYPTARLCAAVPDPDRGPKISYRAFADRNVCRRTLLLTASNDGQLHAFDAGIFRDPPSGSAECLLPAKDIDGDGVAEVDEFTDGVIDYDVDDDIESETDHVLDGAYDNGSGREVFSFIPRAMLETQLTFVEEQDRNKGPWGIDGSPRLDDVFIDPQAAEAGMTTCVDREWRSVLVGGYREGGPGYYALDITQPDTMDNLNVPQPTAGYTPSCFDGGVDCGNIPYPSVLWEFQDEHSVELSAGIFADLELDEDLNNERDLGDSWSKAATGRIRVCTGACTPDEAEDRFVAIFGGGLGEDPFFPRGNFIYMVDIETGKLIYKKRVIGSIPADITTVDSNGDTYIDRLYFGTTAGFLYKVQLEASAATPMRLIDQNFQTRSAGVNYNFTAARLSGPVGDLKKYDPFQLFSTGGRPIYYEVAAIYVAQQNRVALAVGTGNRWNLWDFDGSAGRFYALLDLDFVDSDRDGVLNYSLRRLHPAAHRVQIPGDRTGRCERRQPAVAALQRQRLRQPSGVVPDAGGRREGHHRGVLVRRHHHLHLVPAHRGRQRRRHLQPRREEPHLHPRHRHRARLLRSRRQHRQPRALPGGDAVQHPAVRRAERHQEPRRRRQRHQRRRRDRVAQDHLGGAQDAAVDTLPVCELHYERQDDPLRHRSGLHRPGSGLHRSDELEGVLMAKKPHLFLPATVSALAVLAALSALAVTGTARADWLVTRDGARLETKGPWKVDGRRVLFTLPNGALSTIRTDEVDLDQSALVTTQAKEAQAAPAAIALPKKEPVLRLTEKDIPPMTGAEIRGRRKCRRHRREGRQGGRRQAERGLGARGDLVGEDRERHRRRPRDLRHDQERQYEQHHDADGAGGDLRRRRRTAGDQQRRCQFAADSRRQDRQLPRRLPGRSRLRLGEVRRPGPWVQTAGREPRRRRDRRRGVRGARRDAGRRRERGAAELRSA